jgi:hypothetical protein
LLTLGSLRCALKKSGAGITLAPWGKDDLNSILKKHRIMPVMTKTLLEMIGLRISIVVLQDFI